MSFLPYQEGQDNSKATWTTITAVPLSALGTSTGGNGTTAGAAAGGSGAASSATGSGAGASTTGTASAAGSLMRGAGYGAPVAGILALVALLLG